MREVLIHWENWNSQIITLKNSIYHEYPLLYTNLPTLHHISLDVLFFSHLKFLYLCMGSLFLPNQRYISSNSLYSLLSPMFVVFYGCFSPVYIYKHAIISYILLNIFLLWELKHHSKIVVGAGWSRWSSLLGGSLCLPFSLQCRCVIFRLQAEKKIWLKFLFIYKVDPRKDGHFYA